MNFSFDVWTEDLNYDIKCLDAAGNVLTSFVLSNNSDPSNDIDYFSKTCTANQVDLTVTEGGSAASTSIGYSIAGTVDCR